MTDLSLRVELARLELASVQSEFPEFRIPWQAQRLLRFAAGRCSFREAALMLRRWR